MSSKDLQEFMDSLPSITKLPNPVMPTYYIPDEEFTRLTYRIQNDPIRVPIFYSQQIIEFRFYSFRR
jgi:hypothetical protein